jgi:hypothetical protein
MRHEPAEAGWLVSIDAFIQENIYFRKGCSLISAEEYAAVVYNNPWAITIINGWQDKKNRIV